MVIAPPFAIEVESAGIGIRWSAHSQRAVRIAAQRGVGPRHERHARSRILIVAPEVERQFACSLPIGGDRVVSQGLLAKHPWARCVDVAGVNARIIHLQCTRRNPRRAVRCAHGRVVVGAGKQAPAGIKNRAIIFNKDHLVVVAGSGDVARRDSQRRHRGGRDCIVWIERHRADTLRVAIVQPRERLVRFHRIANHRRNVAANFPHRRHGQRANRPNRDRRENALLVLVIKSAPPTVLLLQAGDGHRQPVFPEHPVSVEFEAMPVEGARAIAHQSAVARGARDFRAFVDEPARRTQSKQYAIRPAIVLIPPYSVGIGGRDTRKIIHPDAGRRPPDQDERRQALSVDHRILAAPRLVLVRANLSIHRILHELAHIGDRKVVEKFPRKHRNGAGRVAQRSIQPTARERILGLVTHIATRVHSEGTQLNDCGCRRRRCGGRVGWCGLSRQGRDDGGHEKSNNAGTTTADQGGHFSSGEGLPGRIQSGIDRAKKGLIPRRTTSVSSLLRCGLTPTW